MRKKVLVTGGSGVLGSGLKEIVKEHPDLSFYFPTSGECNLFKLRSLKNYIKKYKINIIVHFAAKSGGIQLTKNYPATIMRDNILMNFNVLEAARLLKIEKTLMTMSGAMYPLRVNLPIKEDSIHEGYPHESNYSYAFAKRIIDPMIKAYRKEFGSNVIGIVPDAILGPKSEFNPKNSTAIPALIRRFFENRSGNKPLIVWGDGAPIRQVSSDLDIARAAVWCVKNYNEEQILNVGTMEEISIKAAAICIAKAMKLDQRRIEFDLSKPSGQFCKSVDNSKFIKVSNFKYMPIQKTIERTVKYFIENFPDKAKLRL